MSQDNVTRAVQRWVETMVVDLNLCPFARKEVTKQRIRYALTEAEDIGTLLQALQNELEQLNSHPDIETTLLIHPHVLTDFLDYNQFLDAADELLRQLGLEGVYQIASFHPDYQFAGTQPGDAENYSNRSPYPLLHLLRESSLERAIEEYPDTADIPERNIRLLEDMGPHKLQQLLAACFASHDRATPESDELI